LLQIISQAALCTPGLRICKMYDVRCRVYDLLIRHGGQVSDLKAMSCDSIADCRFRIADFCGFAD